MASKSLTISFSKKRETKGTHVFVEDGDNGSHVVGKIYIKKPKAADLGNPEKLKVVISAA